MEKAQFNYKKDDGTTSDRLLYRPAFLKESANYLKTLEKEEVKYVQGYEIDKQGLTEEQIKQYEEVLEDYFELANPTIQEWFSDSGLDSKRIKQKVFKKEGVTDFKMLNS
jgi:hypothetical protein